MLQDFLTLTLKPNRTLTCTLNYLGQIPWRINTTLLTILTEASNRKLPLGDLPSLDIPQPKEEDCVRIIPPRKKYKDFQSKEVTPDINDPSDINNDPHPTSIHIPDDSIISDPNRVNMRLGLGLGLGCRVRINPN